MYDSEIGQVTQKLRAVIELMRWHKPIGTSLLLLPTISALFLVSEGWPPLHLFIVFTVGCFVMRSAGCVINDIWDRHIDAEVERTKMRPLASGRISVVTAWCIFAILCICAVSLLYWLNEATRWMAVAGLVIAVLYPLGKRFTYFPQAILGVAFSWGILMASTAVKSEITVSIWILFAASFFWIFAYDTIYAKMDQVDDQRIGVKSSAIKAGKHFRLLLGVFYAVAWLLLAGLLTVAELGVYYTIAIVVLGILFGSHVWTAEDAPMDKLQRKFEANQYDWGVVLAGIVCSVVI